MPRNPNDFAHAKSEKPGVADPYAYLDKEAFEGGSKRDSLKLAETELLFAPPGFVHRFIYLLHGIPYERLTT
jgi:hypothetical protein